MDNICNKIKHKNKPNDVIYTPHQVVDYHLSLLELNETCTYLDPCFGKGAYYDKLPIKKEWTEIEINGSDFFDVTKKYDWIIGNPPYSILDKWLGHTFSICENFSYIIGCVNLTARRMKLIHESGFHINIMSIVKVPTWFMQSVIIVCNKKSEEKQILYKHFGNLCLHCGCPCGGMRGKNIKHCKRKANSTVCSY